MYSRWLRQSFIYLLIAVAVVAIAFTFFNGGDDHPKVSIGEVVADAKAGKVQQIEIDNRNLTVTYVDKNANNKPLILKSLNALEDRLDDKVFFRANRKHIINMRWIEKIEPYFNGGLLLELKGGEKIEVSRRQTVKFKEMMSL